MSLELLPKIFVLLIPHFSDPASQLFCNASLKTVCAVLKRLEACLRRQLPSHQFESKTVIRHALAQRLVADAMMPPVAETFKIEESLAACLVSPFIFSTKSLFSTHQIKT
jgi:hypothetical protein